MSHSYIDMELTEGVQQSSTPFHVDTDNVSTRRKCFEGASNVLYNGASNVLVRERMQEEVCETEMDRVRGAKYVPHEVLEAERSRVKGANYVPHEVFGAVRRRVRGANYVPHDACEVRNRRYGTSSEPRAPVWFETEDYSVENP